MGDKNPKSKDREKKQGEADKKKRQDAASAKQVRAVPTKKS